jgi:hypothetical protein
MTNVCARLPFARVNLAIVISGLATDSGRFLRGGYFARLNGHPLCDVSVISVRRRRSLVWLLSTANKF